MKVAVAVAIAATSVLVSSWPSSAATTQSRKRQTKQTYSLCHYDTVETVADYLDVPEKDVVRWNRSAVSNGKFRRGTRRIVYYSDKTRISESIGRPSSGRLAGGINLDCDGDDMGLGWIISAHRKHLYGTPETIRDIKRASLEYRNYFKGRRMKYVPLAIGDLSARNGGQLPPHASHQSGRDVDVGVVLEEGNRPGSFGQASRASLDEMRTWVMIKSFLDTGSVQYVFMHRGLVDEVRDYVKKIYRNNPSRLRRYMAMFKSGGVIQGDSDHSSHIHIRFKCPKGDKRCQP